jgi:hypothetical protein
MFCLVVARVERDNGRVTVVLSYERPKTVFTICTVGMNDDGLRPVLASIRGRWGKEIVPWPLAFFRAAVARSKLRRESCWATLEPMVVLQDICRSSCEPRWSAAKTSFDRVEWRNVGPASHSRVPANSTALLDQLVILGTFQRGSVLEPGSGPAAQEAVRRNSLA